MQRKFLPIVAKLHKTVAVLWSFWKAMPNLRILSGSDTETTGAPDVARPKVRKAERRKQILLELKLRPHVRIGDLAELFGVSGETIRRDVEALSGDGLISRAHGGASALVHGRYPAFNERAVARIEERERIGRCAAALVEPGETVMIDSGSTTLQCARFLAFNGTDCTVVTNSLPIAMALGSGAAEVILCPGDYLSAEAAVVGVETVDFIERHSVDRCLIGASGLGAEGPTEAVRGFAAIKRAMLRQSAQAHLLIGGDKFGKRGLARVGAMAHLSSVVTDTAPDEALSAALAAAGTELVVAP
ncbi:MAG: DeoR/GlpR family DNA-binding transcription regulator [Pseudomonadota bacterium]